MGSLRLKIINIADDGWVIEKVWHVDRRLPGFDSLIHIQKKYSLEIFASWNPATTSSKYIWKSHQHSVCPETMSWLLHVILRPSGPVSILNYFQEASSVDVTSKLLANDDESICKSRCILGKWGGNKTKKADTRIKSSKVVQSVDLFWEVYISRLNVKCIKLLSQECVCVSVCVQTSHSSSTLSEVTCALLMPWRLRLTHGLGL